MSGRVGSGLRALRAALLAAVLATLTLVTVACGGGGEHVTLTVWSPGNPDGGALAQLDDAFMRAHPDVTIDRVNQPPDTYPTALRSAIAARKGPDVFMWFATPSVFDYHRAAAPLTNLVSDEDKRALIGWDNVSAADGTPYAVPWSGQGSAFYYNKALFRRAGLDPEHPPTSWFDLLSACNALKASGIVPIAAGFKDGHYAVWLLEQFMSQYQTDAERAKSLTAPDWRSPAARKGLERIAELQRRGCFTPGSKDIALFPDAVDDFEAGKGAIFLGLVATAANWSEFADAAADRDIAPMKTPLVPGSRWQEPRLDFGPGLAWIVTRWSDHQEAADDYLSFISGAASQKSMFDRVGTFPNRSDTKARTDDRAGQQLLDWVAAGDTFTGPLATVPAPVALALKKSAPRLIAGRTSVDDVLARMQSAQDELQPVPTH